MVSDALSIDGIKKKLGPQSKLIDYFIRQFGEKTSKSKNTSIIKLYYRIQESSKQFLPIFSSVFSSMLYLTNQG